MHGNLIPKGIIINKMNRTQIVSAAVLSASCNSLTNGEIVDANNSDVLYKAQADD